eukprot:TRINITY_DN17052_c0_g2_i3.p2 TRINITY_DN17052_c0_g2~~TRINITY_DN17052_c0_g2_i3.p2  ORF type:complete len:668 (+),score=214.54 TRINITY_DN17052_c0_g2_i3:2875-4878(+)
MAPPVSFTVTGGYDNKFQWVDLNGVDISNGLLLTFMVLGDTDASVCVTDRTEITSTRGMPEGEGVPAYIVRYANYQNTKTLLCKRDEGVVCQAKHGKLLSPDHFTSLWLNISIDKGANTAVITAGHGLPSKATVLITHVDERSTFKLSQIGFTTWGSSIRVQNLKVTSTCFVPNDVTPTLCPETITPLKGAAVWGDKMCLVAFPEDGFEIACPLLLLYCSSLCKRLIYSAGLGVGRIEIPGVPPSMFVSWYEAVQKFLLPSVAECAVMGMETQRLNIRKLHINNLLHNTEHADLVLTNGADELRVYSYVFRRHSYFSRMLDSRFAEGAMSKITFDTPLLRQLAEAVYIACFNVGQKLEVSQYSTLDIISLAEICVMLGLEQGTNSCESELIYRTTDRCQEFSQLCQTASTLCLKNLRTRLVNVAANIISANSNADFGTLAHVPQDIIAEGVTLYAYGNRRNDDLAYDVIDNCLDKSWGEILCLSLSKDRALTREDSAPLVDQSMSISLGTQGVLAYLKKNADGNIVRQKQVAVTTSSPKNPLSAGWRLFNSRPLLHCTYTQAQKTPFVSIKFTTPLVRSVTPTHYEFAQGQDSEMMSSWSLKGRLLDGTWVTLDRQCDKMLLPFKPAQFEMLASGCAVDEVQFVRTDSAQDLSMTHFEIFGMVTGGE